MVEILSETFTITVKRTRRTRTDEPWSEYQKVKNADGKDNYDYVPCPNPKYDKTESTIYEQTVDVLNLGAVINAVNGPAD